MLHYENKVEMFKTEKSNHFHSEEVWNFSVFGLLLVCSHSNTSECLGDEGGWGEATTRTTTIPPPPTSIGKLLEDCLDANESMAVLSSPKFYKSVHAS